MRFADEAEPAPRVIRVRHAERGDAAAVAPLLCAPRPGLVELLGSDGGARRAARALFRGERTLESFQHAWIAEAAAGVLAVVLVVPASHVAASRVRTGLTMIAAAPWRAPRIVGLGRVLDELMLPVPAAASFLAALAVRDGDRGAGLGRTLLHTAIAAAAHDGCRRICLDVGIENDGARRFYERLGFVEVARTRTPEGLRDRVGTRGLIRLEKTLLGLDPV